MSGPPKVAFDLHRLTEDERIEYIGEYAQQGNVCGVFVDNDVIADRYVKRITENYFAVLDFRGRLAEVPSAVFLRFKRAPIKAN